MPKTLRAAARKQKAGLGMISTDPAWEAAKAARRNLSHRDAIRETVFLQQQYQRQWRSQMTPSPVDLDQILQTLTRKKIPFVLTGTHGIAGWTGRPRATQDVDILTKGGRNHARAVKALHELYPQLEVRNFPGVTGFFLPGEKQSVIDVIYPHRPDLEETLASPLWVVEHGVRYRIPYLEAILANKYGAMLNPTREPDKRLLDAADFTQMVKHSTDAGRQPIDLEKLQSLGEKVWPSGGGKEILQLVEVVKQGGIIDLNALIARHKV